MDFRFPKLTMPDMRQITSDATTMFSRAKQVYWFNRKIIDFLKIELKLNIYFHI